MSFFSSFGQQNNNPQQQQQQQQPQSAPFGGFGGTTAPAFGGGSGFGTNTAGNTATPFGQNRPFGAPTTGSGGIFGGASTATTGAGSGFGGFGNTANTQQQGQANPSPFGGGGNAFGGGGAAKPFGATASTGSGIFGGGGAAFGGNNTSQATPAFGGASTGNALGGSNPLIEGTGGTPFQAFTDKEQGSTQTNHFQSITFQAPYQNTSFEELRLADYLQGRRFGNTNQTGSGFGTAGGAFGGGFGNTGNNTSGGFGGTNTATGIFGQNQTNNTAPFGTSTQGTTGGFGSTAGATGGIFGAKPAGNNPFGGTATSAQPTAGIFGTSGNNPGGFGNTGATPFGQAAGTNPQQTGGFGLGGAGTTGSGGFGTGFGTSNAGSAFGAPTAGTTGGFGMGQQPQGATAGFGQLGGNANANQTAQATSLFGQSQNKPGGIFGGAANTGATGPGLFSAAGNQTGQTASAFGGNMGNQATGLFGNKPLGQTGATQATGSSLFGALGNTGINTNNAGIGGNTGGSGLFPSLGGNNNAQNQPNQGGGGLFASLNQPKPGGLFGPTPLNNNTSNQQGASSLFGGSTLLGSNNNNNNNNSQPALGGGLFGPSGQTQPQQQQQLGGFGSSLFGNSVINQSQNQQPPSLSTSINDIDPFGSFQLFNGLNPTNLAQTGPLATPLSSSQKLKKSTILPHYKMNPSASTRLTTPQRRGYGFSYTTFGTPGSFSSTASTPAGTGGSYFGGSFGRTLGKSLSMNNLHRNYSNDESVLSPGAFSASANRQAGGNLKRLVINRSLRPDLFSPPSSASTVGALPAPNGSARGAAASAAVPNGPPKKKVTFDSPIVNGTDRDHHHSSSSNIFSEAQQEDSVLSTEEQGFPQLSTTPPTPANRESTQATTNGTSEGTQVRGNELAVVPEDETPSPEQQQSSSSNGLTKPKNSNGDPEEGEYWMRPSKEQLQKMSREQLKRVTNFEVGRHGCGFVAFRAPVDLTTIDLDHIFGHIVQIQTRSLTVYPDKTPEMGKGLNVPARITLESSWPRGKNGRGTVRDTSGPRVEKHINRLQRIEDTRFESYNPRTGVWIFTVDHFTTYAMDYDDDDDEPQTKSIPNGDDDQTKSTGNGPPKTPIATNKNYNNKQQSTQSQQSSANVQDVSMMDVEEQSSPSGLEDTFEFHGSKQLPGAFTDPEDDEDEEMKGMSRVEMVHQSDKVSFFGNRSMGSASEGGVEDSANWSDHDAAPLNESVVMMDQEMAGSYPDLDQTVERYHDSLQGDSFGNNRIELGRDDDMPTESPLYLDGDWTQHLQRTISPRKQNRSALRDMQMMALMNDHDETTPPSSTKEKSSGRDFNTSIDLMRSLFGQYPSGGNKMAKKNYHGRGQEIEKSHRKKARMSGINKGDAVTPGSEASTQLMRPIWGPRGTLIYAMPGADMSGKKGSTGTREPVVEQRSVLVSEGKDVRFTRLRLGKPVTKTLELQRTHTTIHRSKGIPHAQLNDKFEFADLAALVEGEEPQEVYETLVWSLLSCLFDPLDSIWPKGVSPDEKAAVEILVRKDRLSEFWKELVRNTANDQVRQAKSKEEEAIAHLSANRVDDACLCLLHGRDFRLATLVSLMEGNATMQREIRAQLGHWREQKVLSEFSDPMRAIYELLAWNAGECEGVQGPQEDRVEPFLIPERFNMNWKQAFGLRFWYGIGRNEPIETAIRQFEDHLSIHRKDRARPVPWLVEEYVYNAWDDVARDQREDLLWGIMKMYANYMEGKEGYPLEEVISPENHQLSPVDFRLSWQLYKVLQQKQIGAFGGQTINPGKMQPPNPKADQLTLDFAWQLEMADEWLWAMWVVLHLPDVDRRVCAIRGLLARHSGEVGDGPSDKAFSTLVQDLLIPTQWIWEAKALHARSVTQDHVTEVRYLLEANNWDEAHETLVTTVAPQAIIEDDLEILRDLLKGFQQKETIEGWSLGGKMYEDYVRLMELMDAFPDDTDRNFMNTPMSMSKSSLSKSGRQTRSSSGGQGDDGPTAIVLRLLKSLPAMMQPERRANLHQRVATQEMSEVVAEVISNRNDEAQISRLDAVKLPLGEDQMLKYTVDLSLRFYHSVMRVGDFEPQIGWLRSRRPGGGGREVAEGVDKMDVQIGQESTGKNGISGPEAQETNGWKNQDDFDIEHTSHKNVPNEVEETVSKTRKRSRSVDVTVDAVLKRRRTYSDPLSLGTDHRQTDAGLSGDFKSQEPGAEGGQEVRKEITATTAGDASLKGPEQV
ncbi:MAG: hypothetical protein M1823_000875 [Watsoniomyces obsoletus]|nr:MAG: hypothetical protein M1823_000875 [Watsoniomyces obsoletus]